MNTTETMQHFEGVTNQYLEELNLFSIEQLKRQPSENEWSLGQMYIHLIQTAQRMQIGNIEKCRSQIVDASSAAGVKTGAGEAVFTLGSFPPDRIQVPPSPQYTPEQPVSKEQIIDGLHAVLQKMKEIAPLVEAISPAHTTQHPRLGVLNAKEWFALVEMHYRHHLLQLGRLKAFITSREAV
jgi:hypothetical protein